ncbi:MAG: uracil-DNA glycosylase family protein, partial [Opitutus sp.]
MNHAITALTDELRRLKATGVKMISVSDESLALLRKAGAKNRAPGESAGSMTPSAPRLAQPPAVALQAQAPTPSASAEPKKLIPQAVEGTKTLPAPTPFELPKGSKGEQMAALRERIIADAVCQANLRVGKQVVVGVGSLDAKIMFVGEAPGAEEEDRGEPFVGPAGQLLTKMITAMGLSRNDVYIGNIMNWRPQLQANDNGVQFGNRPPTADEMNYCLQYLKAQIQIVNPELLVALGTTAAQGLLGPGCFKALGEVRGRWSEFGSKPLMVTYHPSYILRNQSNRSKRAIWEDLLKVMERA